MMRLWIAAIVLATAAAPMALQKPKYGVQVTAEKNVDFAKFRTYTWTRAQPSPDKTVDAQIVAAVDRELAALGLTKAASGPGDVHVSYASLSRTDVDVEGKKDEKGLLPQQWVGTLVVALNEPASNRRVLRMRVDLPIDIQPSQLEAAINHAAELMFAEYPTKKKK